MMPPVVKLVSSFILFLTCQASDQFILEFLTYYCQQYCQEFFVMILPDLGHFRSHFTAIISQGTAQ
jgi:hypothetical protein